MKETFQNPFLTAWKKSTWLAIQKVKRFKFLTDIFFLGQFRRQASSQVSFLCLKKSLTLSFKNTAFQSQELDIFKSMH